VFTLIVVGALVLIAWHTGSTLLIQVAPGLDPIPYNTALGLLGCGLFLLLSHHNRITLASIPGTFVFLLGLLTLTDYIFQINMGIDEFFMRDNLATENSITSRMAPNTALCFMLTAIAGRLNTGNLWKLRVSGVVSSFVSGLGIVALSGYIFHTEAAYRWGELSSMSVPESIGFIFLGVGLSVQNWFSGFDNTDINKFLLGRWSIGYPVAWSVIIFMIDLSLPIEYSVGLFYILLLFYSYFLKLEKATFGLALLASILLIAGFVVHVDFMVNPLIGINRLPALILIWLTAFLIETFKYRNRLNEQIRSKLDEEVTLKTQALHLKNKELEQFVYFASHDLQEPLRTISSFIGRLQISLSSGLDETGKKSMRYISEAAVRMSELIRQLLDFSRIGNQSELEIINCNEIVEEVKSDLQLQISQSNATIQSAMLPVLTGYRTELRLLFQNLISNALKFKRECTAPILVINAKKKNGKWLFSFADNGLGIKSADQDRIFAIFQRLHPREEFEGTGVGLSHCRKIAEIHHGSMWVESEEGHGSTFYFTIDQSLK
jgi:signal transduction histidine kinase